MQYISTRGSAPKIGFDAAVVSGLAPDGGLYVPEAWPVISAAEIEQMGQQSYGEIAAHLLAVFSGGNATPDNFRALTDQAFASFDHPETIPLVPLDHNSYLMELFHGPTLAFKDVAMQVLARLYARVCEKASRRKTILGATSGDTGGAAIAAFANSPAVDLFILHPKGRISEVQRRIMTTRPEQNIINLAVDGSFDDCQRIVKALFVDDALNAKLDLAGVNSINWVRLAVQTVYYFATAARLGLGQPASYIVPTGNFGDVFAGYVAKRMGVPISKLGVAVNRNDILHRALTTGEYRPSSVTPTMAPSMDIQVASNFERLLFDAMGKDDKALSSLMDTFARENGMQIPKTALETIQQEFVSERAEESEIDEKIKSIKMSHDMSIDPHTAIGLVAADKLLNAGKVSSPVVTLATAHPAKFPDAVQAASGRYPELPKRYDDLYEREERLFDVPNDVRAIANMIIEMSKNRG
ncbi:MAG: threonine synthase [Pseudomonadota bacterium]